MIKRIFRKVSRILKRNSIIKDKTKVTYWINEILGSSNNTLVQIGSNDGFNGDPLYPLFKLQSSWKGLFVEPIPYLYEKLKNNYAYDDRFRFENCAISDDKDLTFYWVDPKVKEVHPELPYWHDQLGSFDKTHLTKHLEGKLVPFIKSSQIDTLTLSELFKKHELKLVDLLHIDVEGHDWIVLSQLPVDRFLPKIILFEYTHLSESDLSKAYSFLRPYYDMFYIGIDIFCIRKELNASQPVGRLFQNVNFTD